MELTQTEKINLGSKEITKRIREQIKKEFLMDLEPEETK